MKRSIKTAIAGSLLLGTFVVADLPEENVAEASETKSEVVTPWYEYNGDAGYDARFVLDKTFIEAVKANNVKLNGVLIDLDESTSRIDPYQQIETKQIYDQTFHYIKGTKRPYQTTFSVYNDLLTTEAVKEAYKDYKVEEFPGAVTVTVGNSKIVFYEKRGIVTNVIL